MFDQSQLPLQFRSQLFLGRQHGSVFGGEQLFAIAQHGVLHHGHVFVGAKDQSDGGVVVFASFQIVEQNGPVESTDETNPTTGRWCIGGEAFRDRLLERIEGLLDGKRKDSIRGAEVRETVQRQAEKLILRGLRVVSLRDC
jgi:hypothetical protein